MIECIFTIDYEIYGNGEGSLQELVYDPAEKLITIFTKAKKRFVAFIEVAELEVIEAEASDPAMGLVKRQIQDLCQQGFELGLHLHPQWYNARHEKKSGALITMNIICVRCPMTASRKSSIKPSSIFDIS